MWDGEGREALWQHSDERDTVVRQVEGACGQDGKHHGDEDAGDLRQPPLERHDEEEPEHSDRKCGRHGLAVHHTPRELAHLGAEAASFDGESEELRELADEDRQGQTVHVPDHGRLRDQVREEPEPRDAGERRDRPDEERKRRGERDRALRIPVRSDEDDRRGDHRAERRVRAQHEDPGGSEECVPRQTEDRCVEPGDRREAGELGIGHPLGYEQRRQDQSRNEVLAQPRSPVRRQRGDSRNVRSLHATSVSAWQGCALPKLRCASSGGGDQPGYERGQSGERARCGGDAACVGRDANPQGSGMRLEHERRFE